MIKSNKTATEEKILTPKKLLNKISKEFRKINNSSFLDKYIMFMGKAQLVEFELKRILLIKFKYKEEKLERMTLGTAICELKKIGLRSDLIFLLEGLRDHRNNLAHDFLGITIIGNSIAGHSFQRLQNKELEHALFKVEEVIQVYIWLMDKGYLTFKK